MATNVQLIRKDIQDSKLKEDSKKDLLSLLTSEESDFNQLIYPEHLLFEIEQAYTPDTHCLYEQRIEAFYQLYPNH